MTQSPSLSCACGRIRLALQGQPITSVECCCASCRQAGARLQALPEAPAFLSAQGTTPFVLYRKDRVSFLEGAELLREFRLGPEARTRRVVASCCNTPVFLEFTSGHWLSLYGCLWPSGSRPPLEMRTMVSDLPQGMALPADVPNARQHSAAFMFRLLGAWIAMGFRSPKLGFVQGELHA